MTFKPINDNVVIKISKQEVEKSKNGLILSVSNSGFKPDQGEIIAVGDGRIAMNGEKVKINVNPGDKIIFNKFAGVEIEDGTEDKYMIIKECDILSVIE